MREGERGSERSRARPHQGSTLLGSFLAALFGSSFAALISSSFVAAFFSSFAAFFGSFLTTGLFGSLGGLGRCLRSLGLRGLTATGESDSSQGDHEKGIANDHFGLLLPSQSQLRLGPSCRRLTNTKWLTVNQCRARM